jgi:CheY-like chemotaxis protein/anti-sigma regulatory factor (Ser/Thr protein kinase)
MSVALVVDDSPLDRRLIGGLLEKDPQWTVHYAQDGLEALEQMRRTLPDLVITDLLMPGMDGLALVRAVRKEYPAVPVILITAQGSDEIAVDALQQGAATYVPKHALASDLVASIRAVMAVSGHRKRQARFMDCLRRTSCEFVLDNDDTLFPPLVGFLQDSATQLGLCDETDRVRIGIALEEALVNALYHGNLELDSSLREADCKAYGDLAHQRRLELPYRDRRIHVRAQLARDLGVFVVRDDGPGFNPCALPDPTDPANLERVTGRGVLLMRSFMDEICYNSTGNEVTLTKRRPAAP